MYDIKTMLGQTSVRRQDKYGQGHDIAFEKFDYKVEFSMEMPFRALGSKDIYY